MTLASLGVVAQTSLLLIFFVSFNFGSVFGLKVGGRMLSGSFGAGGLADFFTICSITLEFFLPLSLIGFGPPGSGVVGLCLRGRSGSMACLSINMLVDLLRSALFLTFTLELFPESDRVARRKEKFLLAIIYIYLLISFSIISSQSLITCPRPVPSYRLSLRAAYFDSFLDST